MQAGIRTRVQAVVVVGESVAIAGSEEDKGCGPLKRNYDEWLDHDNNCI